MLTTWYVNRHRALEVLGPNVLEGYWGDPGAVAALLGRHVMRWMQEKEIPSLTRLVSTRTLCKGRFFFHDARYFSRGMRSSAHATSSAAMLWYPMKELVSGRTDRLEIPFNIASLTTDSAFGALQRSPIVFVCAVVTAVEDERIEARPLVIGSLVEDWGGLNPSYAESREIRAADFDAFSGIDFNRSVSLKEIGRLRNVPEAKVKEVFAHTLGQPFRDKDWGGEIGDLFVSRAMVAGKATNCGFMFKGPAVFRKLQPADCGHNGDQVVRLYDYPADCFVLQHCHDIAPTVRKMMRAFAVEKLPRRVRYCLIDGSDTYLILKKFGALRPARARGK